MRFARYIAVQLVAYGLDVGAYLGVLWFFGSGPLIANASGKILAGIFAFYTHRSFTFSAANEGQHARQVPLYFLVLSLNVPLSSFALWSVLLVFPSPVSAKVLADVACVSLTYWVSKRYVFSVSRSSLFDSSINKRDIL